MSDFAMLPIFKKMFYILCTRLHNESTIHFTNTLINIGQKND